MKPLSLAACAAISFAAFAAPVVDPAEFGFSPSASPEVNAVALQKALDGGKKTVKCAKPGVYGLDRTIFLDSDTTLEFAPGTVLKKMKPYASVLLNRGALCYGMDSNIVVRNVEISVNQMQDFYGPDSNAPGLRGHFAFYRVKNCEIYNFTCNDCEGGQYCWQIAEFDGILLDGFTIRGKKDGLHVNRGKNFILRNGVLRTGDDGVALNAGDWPGACTPVMGSIENGLVENVVDEDGGKCNFARVITGVWTQWHPGMKLQRDDIVLAGQNVYAVHPHPVSTNEFVAVTKPTHTHGVWQSPEGINYQFLHADGCSRADIKNVTFRNVKMQCQRSFSCSWEMGSWARLVHPEIDPKDYPVIDITLENVVKTVPGNIVGGTACANVKFVNCRAEKGQLAAMGRISSHGSTGKPYPTVRKFTVENCEFDGKNYDFALYDPLGTAEVKIVNCKGEPKISASSKVSVVK